MHLQVRWPPDIAYKNRKPNSGQHMSFQQTKPGMYKGSWFEASLIPSCVMNDYFIFISTEVRLKYSSA